MAFRLFRILSWIVTPTRWPASCVNMTVVRNYSADTIQTYSRYPDAGPTTAAVIVGGVPSDNVRATTATIESATPSQGHGILFSGGVAPSSLIATPTSISSTLVNSAPLPTTPFQPCLPRPIEHRTSPLLR